MARSNRAFKLTVPSLADVNEADWKDYIRDAVGCWKGQFHPNNPLFDLDYEDVKVVRLREEKRPVVEATLFTDLAAGLLKEAIGLLGDFSEGGLHHPVCDLIQRIEWLLEGETEKLKE